MDRSSPTAPGVVCAIQDLDDDGRGVGQAGGLELHIAGALPGETVRARIEHRSPHAPRAWASLLGLASPPSQERVPPACPNHGRCGGCMLQHLAYPAQLSHKRRVVERELGAHAALAEVPVGDVVASPHELHYRNKAKYVLAARPGGGLMLGAYAPASHDVIDMAGCQVCEEPIDAVARAAVRLLGDVAPYDERERRGELRYLVVRSDGDGRALVVVVTHGVEPRAALARAARRLVESEPAVAGVVMNVNPATSGRILGDQDEVLAGVGTLTDRVGDVSLVLSARAFFQVNRGAAGRLYAAVAEAAGARAGVRAVDLYSGVGGIALTLAARGARVVGVESLASATADARASAAALGLPGARARFIDGDAADGLPAAARLLGGLDVLIVDPPRKGLSPAARAAVVRAGARRVVYVSCNPRSLAADLAALSASHRVESVLPFDLMPGTPHVEAVAVLRRSG